MSLSHKQQYAIVRGLKWLVVALLVAGLVAIGVLVDPGIAIGIVVIGGGVAAFVGFLFLLNWCMLVSSREKERRRNNGASS